MTEDVHHIVYLARNTVNGGEYVGMTKKSLQQRRKEHERDATSGKGFCRKFHAALRKYGADAFEWSVIAEVSDRPSAAAREIEEIASRKTRYNITAGGPGVIAKRTPEWVARISAALKGRKRTPEQIQKIKDSRKPGQGERPVFCLEDRMLFPSISAAAAFYGTKAGAVSRAAHKSGQTMAAQRHFVRTAEIISEDQCTKMLADFANERLAAIQRVISVRAKPVVHINTGIEYPTAAAAARALDLSMGTIGQICINGGITNAGHRFRFADADEVIRPMRPAAAVEAGRKARSEKLKARRHPPETIKRMKAAAKLRGVSDKARHAQREKQRKHIVCVETGTVFRDAAAAGLAHGVDRQHVYNQMQSPRPSRLAGVSFRHALPHERDLMHSREAV